MDVPAVPASGDGRAEALAAALERTRFGPVRWFCEIGSTNTWLAERARAARAGPGAVAVADLQTAGRGRLDRRWEAPAGSALMLSVLVALPAGEAGGLVPLAMGMAALDALPAAAAGQAGLKWPNDVIVPGRGDRKMAGILAEALVLPAPAPGVPAARLAVVGIGLNVVRPPDPPPVLAERAVWLDELAGAGGGQDNGPPDRVVLAARLLTAFDARLAGLEQAPGAFLDAYRQRCLTIGRAVRVELADGALEGVAAGVAGDGHLYVDVVGRERLVLAAGDVVHLRSR